MRPPGGRPRSRPPKAQVQSRCSIRDLRWRRASNAGGTAGFHSSFLRTARFPASPDGDLSALDGHFREVDAQSAKRHLQAGLLWIDVGLENQARSAAHSLTEERAMKRLLGILGLCALALPV